MKFSSNNRNFPFSIEIINNRKYYYNKQYNFSLLHWDYKKHSDLLFRPAFRNENMDTVTWEGDLCYRFTHRSPQGLQDNRPFLFMMWLQINNYLIPRYAAECSLSLFPSFYPNFLWFLRGYLYFRVFWRLIELPTGKYLPVAYSVSSTSCPQIVTLF